MDKLLLVIVPKTPRFTLSQFQTLVDICVGVSLVTLASIVLPAVIDRGFEPMLIFGGIGTVSLWVIAFWLSRRIT
jgi:hypothetical protein